MLSFVCGFPGNVKGTQGTYKGNFTTGSKAVTSWYRHDPRDADVAQ